MTMAASPRPLNFDERNPVGSHAVSEELRASLIAELIDDDPPKQSKKNGKKKKKLLVALPGWVSLDNLKKKKKKQKIEH